MCAIWNMYFRDGYGTHYESVYDWGQASGSADSRKRRDCTGSMDSEGKMETGRKFWKDGEKVVLEQKAGPLVLERI